MAGIISPSMPVWVVENATAGNRAFCNLNEGLGKVLRFGANCREVLDAAALDGRRRSAPTLAAGRSRCWATRPQAADGPGAAHGRRVHNRNAAASALLFKRLAPALLKSDSASAAMPPRRSSSSPATTTSSSTSRWPRARRCSTPRTACAGSSMVTAMARNGVDFGIRVSGTGERWFTGARAGGERPLLPRLHRRGRRAGPRRQRHHRDRRARRLRDGGGARDRPVRRRHAGGRDRQHARDDAHHARAQRRFTLPALDFARHAGRASTRGAWSIPACCRSSTPASRTRRRASARSAPASRARRSRASRRPSLHSLSELKVRAHEARTRRRRVRRQRADPRSRSTIDPRAVRRPSADRRATSPDGRAGLERGGVARQRAAGRLHPAALGDRR